MLSVSKLGRRRLAVLGFALTLVALPSARSQADELSPEAATGRSAKAAVHAERHMVAAANPHAAEAGRAILRQGGSAADAAIAAQLVLNLVEPQSSGIGGGAFLLHWDSRTRTVASYDGRETAPAGAEPDMWLASDGKPRLPFPDVFATGQAVGVPGLVRLLALVHDRHGRLPWARLFEPAIALAEAGFAMSPRLHGLLAGFPDLAGDPALRALYFDEAGEPKAVGAPVINRAFAATLRQIAEDGADAFYEGPLAGRIAERVQNAPHLPGTMTAEDVARYEAKERPPVCAPYRRWRVCGMGPPSSGGVALLQMLGMLARHDLAGLDPNGVEAVHLLAEAGRLAFADRARYAADPDFVPVPVEQLLAPDYLAKRDALIRPGRSMGRAEPGRLPDRRGSLLSDDPSLGRPSTSHLSVVDDEGNAVALTSSIEHAFGARLAVQGFLLNNQLTDFSFLPMRDGRPVANRVEPGKRPRSSMSPTLVFDAEGRLVLVIGSPGGSRIIGYVLRAVTGVLDWKLDVQAAIDLPHALNRNGATELEGGTALEALKGALEARGHAVSIGAMTSGLHGIQITRQGLTGGADPRREGVALGD